LKSCPSPGVSASQLAEIGGHGKLRANGDNLAISSYGSLVLDVTFPADADIQIINHSLSGIPGVIEHGVFTGLTTAIFCGQDDQVIAQWR